MASRERIVTGSSPAARSRRSSSSRIRWILASCRRAPSINRGSPARRTARRSSTRSNAADARLGQPPRDRKSTRLNSSHLVISYAVFCLKKKNERPVQAAELIAFTLRVRAGHTDVLTDAEDNVRQQLRAEGVMYCLKVNNVLALALVVRS